MVWGCRRSAWASQSASVVGVVPWGEAVSDMPELSHRARIRRSVADNPAMITVHGIPNCDTVKKARAWLQAQGLDHHFHDFRKQGVPDALDLWLADIGWNALLNRKGTTWRGLDDATRAGVTDGASAAALMRAQPSVIKRPVVRWSDGSVTVGFSPADWAGRG